MRDFANRIVDVRMASSLPVLPPIASSGGLGNSVHTADDLIPENSAGRARAISERSSPSSHSAQSSSRGLHNRSSSNSISLTSSQNTRRISFSHNPVTAKKAHEQRELERIGAFGFGLWLLRYICIAAAYYRTLRPRHRCAGFS